VIDAALAAHASLDRDRPALRVLPVATRIDDSEFERTEKWMSLMSETFSPYLAAWSTEAAVDADRAFRSLAVPYVPYWSYGEELPVDLDHAGDPRSVLAAHHRLQVTLLEGKLLDDSDQVTHDEEEHKFRIFCCWTSDIYAEAKATVAAARERNLRVSTQYGVRLGAKKSEWYANKMKHADAIFVLVGDDSLLRWVNDSLTEQTENNPGFVTPIIPIYRKLSPVHVDISWLTEYQGTLIQSNSDNWPETVADFMLRALTMLED
jgi:hypothetical protein